MREDCHFGSHRHGIILSPSHRRPNAYRCLPKVCAGRVGNIAGLPIKRGDGSVGRCGSAAPLCVCVLRKAWSPPLGGCCGTLAAAVSATSGYRRIGSGSADRKRVPAVQSFFRARRWAAGTAQDRSRRARRTSARQLGHSAGCCARGSALQYAAHGQALHQFVRLQQTNSTPGGSRRILCAIGA
jgi:hypothetical protein